MTLIPALGGGGRGRQISEFEVPGPPGLHRETNPVSKNQNDKNKILEETGSKEKKTNKQGF